MIGAFEIYADAARIENSIASKKRLIWLATFIVFVLLWALLGLLVRGASEMLRRQTDQLRKRSKDLMAAYARLEESSLEAMEALNATVEAKDPYTAGHSLRVQRIAVAIGEELKLPKSRVDPLRLGALFHDIGKIAVPDAVLTKPARLTDAEFALIKRHSEDGARIVAKFGPLRAAVPIIRHHHERWDGSGYPDRVAGEEIPLEASIVATCGRLGRDDDGAAVPPGADPRAGLRRGPPRSWSQFCPEVVDAFFAAQKRRPGEFWPQQTEPVSEQRTLRVRRRLRRRCLGQDELLPRADRRPGQLIPALELPDALARIARIPRGRDRPERVAGLHDVDLRLPGALDRPGHHAPAEKRGNEGDEEDPTEHVFAMLVRTSVRVKS